MATQGETNATTAPAALGFVVDRERCDGCVACVNVFPAIFKMDGEKAAIYATTVPADALPSRILNACPVRAIRSTTETETPKPAPALEVVPGWETTWEAHRRDPEDLLERERRYGRIHDVREVAGCYVLRIELPRRMPNHELLYMYGIPMGPPEYGCTLQPVGPATISVRARLLDPRLVPLSGKLNSFPLGLKVDYRFPRPIAAAFHRMDAHDLWVYAFREGNGDPQSRLAEVVREHLSTI